MRRTMGWLFAILALISLAAFTWNLVIFFSPRDAQYTKPILLIALALIAATTACGFTARRLLSTSPGHSLWPLGLLGGIVATAVVVFYATLSH